MHNSKPYCWKFHFWNLNGYFELSAVEGLCGRRDGEWESKDARGVQVDVKNKEHIYVGRK